MRLIWSGFLVTGLLLIGMSAFERQRAKTDLGAPGAVTCEDGTPMPQPYPTPRPKTK
jgi:hypothetical protein